MMTLQRIDPQGDVILKTSGNTSLLVSSKILSLASPVFAAMFSPHFREGISLSSAAPITVDLPEDPPDALETICNVVHFRHNHVKEYLSSDQILDVVIVADKYDMASSLGPWREKWLGQLLVNVGFNPGLYRLVLMMWVFDCEGGFKHCTRMVAKYWKGEEEVGEEGIIEQLPDRVIDAIAAKRNAAIEKLLAIAEDARLHYQSPGKKCKSYYYRDCDATVLCSIINSYADIGLFPMPVRPYYSFSVNQLGKDLERILGALQGHQKCLEAELREVLAELGKVLGGELGLDLKEFK